MTIFVRFIFLIAAQYDFLKFWLQQMQQYIWVEKMSGQLKQDNKLQDVQLRQNLQAEISVQSKNRKKYKRCQNPKKLLCSRSREAVSSNQKHDLPSTLEQQGKSFQKNAKQTAFSSSKMPKSQKSNFYQIETNQIETNQQEAKSRKAENYSIEPVLLDRYYSSLKAQKPRKAKNKIRTKKQSLNQQEVKSPLTHRAQRIKKEDHFFEIVRQGRRSKQMTIQQRNKFIQTIRKQLEDDSNLSLQQLKSPISITQRAKNTFGKLDESVLIQEKSKVQRQTQKMNTKTTFSNTLQVLSKLKKVKSQNQYLRKQIKYQSISQIFHKNCQILKLKGQNENLKAKLAISEDMIKRLTKEKQQNLQQNRVLKEQILDCQQQIALLQQSLQSKQKSFQKLKMQTKSKLIYLQGQIKKIQSERRQPCSYQSLNQVSEGNSKKVELSQDTKRQYEYKKYQKNNQNKNKIRNCDMIMTSLSLPSSFYQSPRSLRSQQYQTIKIKIEKLQKQMSQQIQNIRYSSISN